MPRQRRVGQPEFPGHQRLHHRAGQAERGQRARRAAELDREPGLAGGREPVERGVEAGQPARRDHPEGDRHGLLEQRPPDHQRPAVRVGQPGDRVGGGVERADGGVDGVTGQHHRRRVDDVLTGRALVHGRFGGRVRHQPGQRPGQPRHRVAGQLRRPAELGQVEVAGPGGGRGHGRPGPRRRQTGPLEGARERRLGRQHGPQPGGVVGDGPAAGEHAAEDSALGHVASVPSLPIRRSNQASVDVIVRS